MTDPKCPGCGASGPGLVCRFCGSRMRDVVDEPVALAEYHALLQAEVGEKLAGLLRHGFLPSSESMLIEAGMRCLPLIRENHHDDESKAAAARLEAIVARLKVTGASAEANRAIYEFESNISLYRSSARKSTLLGCLILSTAGLIALGLVLWLILT